VAIKGGVVNRFREHLKEKHMRELLTAGLTTPDDEFVGGNSYRYKGRYYTAEHDADAEFAIDPFDVVEDNLEATILNITNVYETEHAIPQLDAYRISAIYQNFVMLGGEVDARELTAENVLEAFEGYMSAMDDADIPTQGRILYVTPAINRLFGEKPPHGAEVVVMPRGRMRTEYDFKDGFVPADGAKQINMMLVSPQSVVAAHKHSYIKLWPPGTHTLGDMYLYQNRQYAGIFIVEEKMAGVAINVH